jgi:restriction system protein
MLKMHENSLFAVLLRSSWWVSFLVAAAVAALSVWLLEKFGLSTLYAIFTASPFFVIGCVSLWRQLRAPSAERIAGDLEKLRALSWEDFAAKLEAAYRREGYEVKRTSGAADLEAEKAGRVLLVAGKRWKAQRTGVEPLRELDAMRQQREAAGAVYVSAGEITDNARAYAAKSGIALLEGAALTGKM